MKKWPLQGFLFCKSAMWNIKVALRSPNWRWLTKSWNYWCNNMSYSYHWSGTVVHCPPPKLQPVLHLLNFSVLLKPPPPLLLSAPHISSTQPEVKELFSGPCVGGSGGGSPSSIALYARTPGPSTWQCDNALGLFKRDPVFVKCSSPRRAPRAGSGDPNSAGERRGPTLITQCQRDGLFD